MRRTRQVVLCLAALQMLAAPALDGHPFEGSIATLLLEPGSLQVEVSLDLKDLERGFGLDADRNGSINGRELVDSLPRVYTYLRSHLRVAVDGSRLDLQPYQEAALKERIAAMAPEGGFPEADYASVHIGYLFRNPLAAHPKEVAVELDVFDKLGKGHLSVTKLVEKTGSEVLQEHIVLGPERKSHRFQVRSPAPTAPPSSLPTPSPSSPRRGRR